MFIRSVRWIKKYLPWGIIISIIFAGLSACAQPTQSLTQTPIKIGYSASLTGTYTDQGKALVQGVELWRDTVNKNNGLLGHPVTLVGLDDGSNPKRVTTNYQKLINTDHVDLLFGPYSSLLTLPAAIVAHNSNYALFAPTGSAPSVLNKHFYNIFVTTLPSQLYLQSFADFILALPQGIRPKTAAYVSVDNPFATPPVNAAKGLLAPNGLKTVFTLPQPYPANANVSLIAEQVAHSGADIVVLGTSGLIDCISFIKTFKQQHYNPEAIIATSGPNEGSSFLNQLGVGTAEGVFVTKPGWYPGANTYQNDQFTQDYLTKYGGTVQDISATTAEAYSAGQLLEQAVNKSHSLANDKLIQEMHADTFETLQGPTKFDASGANLLGVPFLFQWQRGALIPVYPYYQAQANPEYPKNPWS